MADSNPSEIKFAGETSIDSVKIITTDGFAQDITAQVINIQIFEDISSPFITGSFVLKDMLDLPNLFPFRGQEFVELSVTTPGLPRGNIRSRFYIYKMSNRQLIGDRSVVYQLHFTSEETIVDLNKKISKVFTGNVAELVPQFIKSSTGLESKKNTVVEATTNNIKYISNMWSPVRNLLFLAENAKSAAPNFVFFENRDGFYFVSLDTLYTQDLYQEFTYDNYTRDSGENGKDYRNITRDFKRITEINVPVAYDYMDRISSGMIASKAVSYDVTHKRYTVRNYNLVDKFNTTNHLNPYPPVSGSIIYRANAAHLTYPRMTNQFNGFGDTSNFDTFQQRISLINSSESGSIEIVVPGRCDYTAGQKVSINLHKNQPTSDKDIDITDRMFSGFYLISALNHYITREGHECRMLLIKDSSQLKV